MYDMDTTRHNKIGYLEHYQVMLYPRTGYSPKEIRDYADAILPYPDVREWTSHPIITDGTSLKAPGYGL